MFESRFGSLQGEVSALTRTFEGLDAKAADEIYQRAKTHYGNSYIRGLDRKRDLFWFEDVETARAYLTNGGVPRHCLTEISESGLALAGFMAVQKPNNATSCGTYVGLTFKGNNVKIVMFGGKSLATMRESSKLAPKRTSKAQDEIEF